jgi:hypothetical protein
MPPSCSALSAVVFVRHPVLNPYDQTEEAMKEEECGKERKRCNYTTALNDLTKQLG